MKNFIKTTVIISLVFGSICLNAQTEERSDLSVYVEKVQSNLIEDYSKLNDLSRKNIMVPIFLDYNVADIKTLNHNEIKEISSINIAFDYPHNVLSGFSGKYGVILIETKEYKEDQENKEYIITEKDNEKWLANFEQSSKKTRLNLLHNRMLADSITALRRSWCSTGLSKEAIKKMSDSEKDFFKDKVKVNEKILVLYYIKSTDESIMYSNSSVVSKSNLLTLTSALDVKDIERLEILSPKIAAEAIYGLRGRFGVIQVLIKEEDKFRKVAKIINEITKNS